MIIVANDLYFLPGSQFNTMLVEVFHTFSAKWGYKVLTVLFQKNI